jgi:hypothetical protein
MYIIVETELAGVTHSARRNSCLQPFMTMSWQQQQQQQIGWQPGQ